MATLLWHVAFADLCDVNASNMVDFKAPMVNKKLAKKKKVPKHLIINLCKLVNPGLADN